MNEGVYAWHLVQRQYFDSCQSVTDRSLPASMAEQVKTRIAIVVQRQNVHRLYANHSVAMMDFSRPSIVIGGSS